MCEINRILPNLENSNVTLTSFFLSKPASPTENVQDFTGRNILCHIKSYVL
jgi:hypothetical protein